MTETTFGRDLDLSVEQMNALGYKPTIFRRMLAEHGPVGTAQRLLATAQPSEGFYELARLQRLDLSLEAIVLKHHALFTQDEVQTAQERLETARGW